MLKLAQRPYNIWSRNIFPIDMEGCVLYLPLWQEDMQGSTILSYDQYHASFAVTGTVSPPSYSSQGRVYDGDDVINHTTAFRSSDSSGTIIAWFNTSTDATMSLCASADTAGANHFLTFAVLATSHLLYVNVNGTAGNNGVKGDTDVIDGTWHMGGLTSSGTAWKLYTDDANEETLAALVGANNGAWFGDLTSADNFSVGALVRNTTSAYYTGSFGEVWVFSKELTSAEISYIYQVTKGRYA